MIPALSNKGQYSSDSVQKPFKGKVVEQFASQEMMAYHPSFTRHSLFYWARKAMNSTAEVDYLLESNGKIIPIEIKSGHIGHMRSLHMFIDKYGSQLAVKISQAIYQKGDKVLSLPFYAIQGFMNSRITKHSNYE